MPKEPSAWVRRFAGAIPPGGPVLDLAAGKGRHTRLLRALGFAVTACDRDTAALEAEFAGDPLCRIVRLDLEDGGEWRLGDGYHGIVVVNYLHRKLLPALATALARGGVLIYETFLQGNERLGKPTNPDFLLKPGELLEIYGGALSILAFEQGIVAAPRPAAVQRLAAINGPLGLLP
ncbi:MAG TPA: methyltransferase domain-containing protein [Stellaceae bacterium]|nr:methyltransferase domain-containing protein [Stellaceae bacterium]